MKVWKTQEYFVYFKFFKLHSWGKTSASNRSGFDDWMPIKKPGATDRAGLQVRNYTPAFAVRTFSASE